MYDTKLRLSQLSKQKSLQKFLQTPQHRNTQQSLAIDETFKSQFTYGQRNFLSRKNLKTDYDDMSRDLEIQDNNEQMYYQTQPIKEISIGKSLQTQKIEDLQSENKPLKEQILRLENNKQSFPNLLALKKDLEIKNNEIQSLNEKIKLMQKEKFTSDQEYINKIRVIEAKQNIEFGNQYKKLNELKYKEQEIEAIIQQNDILIQEKENLMFYHQYIVKQLTLQTQGSEQSQQDQLLDLINEEQDIWKKKWEVQFSENQIIQKLLKKKELQLKQQETLINQMRDSQEIQENNEQQEIQNLINQFNEKESEMSYQLQEKESQINQLNQKNGQMKSLLKEKDIQISQLQEKENKLNKQLKEKDKQIQSLLKQQEANKQFSEKIQLQILQSEKQIQEYIQILNPQTIQDKQTQVFIKEYSQIKQNPLSDQDQKKLKNENDKITQELIQDSNKKSQNTNSKGLTETSKGVLLIQQLLENNGITTFLTKESFQEIQQNHGNCIQQSLLSTGQIDNNRYYQFEISQQTDHYTYLQDAVKNEKQMGEFSKYFKNIVGQQLGLKNNDQNILIMRVQIQPQPQVDLKIKDENIKHKNVQNKIQSFKDMGLSLSVQNLLQHAKLSVDMFDPQYNMFWDQTFQNRSEIRGSLKFYNKNDYTPQLYHFPVGYHGLALKVLDKYGQDQRWIGSNGDPSTWICLFHGTSDQHLESIMKTHLKGGDRNACAGSTCRITNEKITSNANVYLTDQISTAQEYSIPKSKFDGKQYYIVFQCRVNPKGVRSPAIQPDYYVVQDSVNDIRPYRILFKEKI